MSSLDRFNHPRLALGLLIALLVFASLGCGGGGGDSESTANRSENTTDASTTTGGGGEATSSTSDHGTSGAATGAAATGTASKSSGHSESDAAAAGDGVVRLVDKGCVQFEPHWATIAQGQKVTWVNETKSPVTVHVEGGAFAKAEFVVAPGARVTSPPALAIRDYKVWTEPGACQGAPLGARGSGPGVAVQAH